MKAYRLRSYENSPPGAYPFTEFSSKPRNFRSQPMLEAQAKIVWGYRRANGLPRATYKEAIEDIDRQTCQRLGNNPLYCIECSSDSPHEVALSESTPGLNGPCKGCGVPV